MPIRRTLLACLLAVLAVPALAGSNSGSDLNLPKALVTPRPTGQSCAMLQSQLDDAIATHPTAPQLASAQSFSISGQRKCAAGDYAGGVKDLVRGLKALKVKPQMS
jgi:hypothetical protein